MLGLKSPSGRGAVIVALYSLVGLLSSPAMAGPIIYLYDALGRVMSVQYSNGSSISYSYDAAGNRTQSVIAPPSPPVAGPVSASVAQNSSGNVIPLNVTGAPTSVAVVAVPGHGTATASGTTIIYSPNTYFSGGDTFSYTATNLGGTSAPGVVNINVIGVAAPVAGSVSASVAQNSSGNPITLNITGSAIAGVAVVSGPSHGVASASGTAISYSPNPFYAGGDNFTYTVTNAGGTSAPGPVSITVNGVAAPIAGPVSQTIGQNSIGNAITLNLGGGLASGVAIATGPSHGAASASGTSISYTPNTFYSGADSFTYTATNAGGTSAPGAVTLTVSGVAAPIANPVSATVAFNAAATNIGLNITGGAATSVAVSGGAGHGTASAGGAAISYAPANGYYGPDSFYYTATNGGGTSAAARVSITVNPAPNPTAVDHSYSMADSVVSRLLSVLLGDNDPSGYALTVIAIGVPKLGSASITGGGASVTYSPSADGVDVFTYTISNGHGGTATATLRVTVTAGGCKGCVVIRPPGG